MTAFQHLPTAIWFLPIYPGRLRVQHTHIPVPCENAPPLLRTPCIAPPFMPEDAVYRHRVCKHPSPAYTACLYGLAPFALRRSVTAITDATTAYYDYFCRPATPTPGIPLPVWLPGHPFDIPPLPHYLLLYACYAFSYLLTLYHGMPFLLPRRTQFFALNLSIHFLSVPCHSLLPLRRLFVPDGTAAVYRLYVPYIWTYPAVTAVDKATPQRCALLFWRSPACHLPLLTARCPTAGRCAAWDGYFLRFLHHQLPRLQRLVNRPLCNAAASVPAHAAYFIRVGYGILSSGFFCGLPRYFAGRHCFPQ